MKTLDSKEIFKFDQLSSKWGLNDPEFKILHDINPLRIKYIQNQINNHFVKNLNINILDYGCGGGIVTLPLYKLGYNIHGVDASIGNIASANEVIRKLKDNQIQNSLKRNKISFSCETIEELQKNDLKYDVVICLEVLEHVINLEFFIQQLLSLVKPQGMVIFSTINKTIKAYLLGIVAAEYILNWIPRLTHTYEKFIKPSTLINFIEENNFVVKDIAGLNFSIFDNSWSFSKIKFDINYFVTCYKVP